MVFIDGNNFESALTGLYGTQQRIDYGKLAEYVAQKRNGYLQRLYYYTAVGSVDKTKAAATKTFVDRLNKRVPKCIAKTGYLKVIGQDKNGNNIFTEKGTDVNIAVDLVSLAFNNGYDEAILFSADSDYESAIAMARSLGKNIVVAVVDKQKAGYIKDLSDDNITLFKTDFDQCMR
ncbi:NYN domain-containing protein [Peribacillus sp. TH16]|nr:NYN domain-containing protein [Peribacillus sp. TH16]MBK5483014.1 NYN domain-containing protein [Peribacillus sp. TH16]